MKKLTLYINEKLKINKDFKQYTDPMLNKLNNVQNDDELIELLDEIVKTAGSNPEIYDDTESFDSSDYFDYWQDASGWEDETYETIIEYCDNKDIIAWYSEDSMEAVEKIIPPMFKYITDSSDWKYELAYKKHSLKTEVWSKNINKMMCCLLKSKMMKNSGGTDYAEYWYILAIETRF